MKQYKDLAFILRRKNFGEADSLITVFSKNHGKLKILARGSRKVSSKLVGHIEPFSIVKISAVSGRSFEILTGSQIEKSFQNLKEDFKILSFVNLICEITDHLTVEKSSNPSIFNLIIETVSLKNWCKDPEIYIVSFLLRLLGVLGFAPHLHSCLKCRKEDLEESYFSHYWGGLLCSKCKDSYPSQKIDKSTVNILQNARFSKDRSIFIGSDKKSKKKALGAIIDFLHFISEKRPNSLASLNLAAES